MVRYVPHLRLPAGVAWRPPLAQRAVSLCHVCVPTGSAGGPFLRALTNPPAPNLLNNARAHSAAPPFSVSASLYLFLAVYADGQICLDILQNTWSPIYDVSAVLTSIQSLLCDPNPSSPANSEAARMFQENKAEYDRRVRLCVEDSWAQGVL